MSDRRSCGRPLKSIPDDGKTMIGIRIHAELRNRLTTAAGANDRTLSQECVRRLRRSFECSCESKS